MIISRTPLRLSFAGGGSDLPSFYRRFGGAVVSTTLKNYVYVGVEGKLDDGVRVSHSIIEDVAEASRVEHPIIRHALAWEGIRGGVTISVVCDLPSRGAGLGSSSALTVGLVHALATFRGRSVDRAGLARDACHIEISLCGQPIGKQDQYAAAFGGVNLFEFRPDDSVNVASLALDLKTLEQIERRILLFDTGLDRNASHILKLQNVELATCLSKQAVVKRMAALAYQLEEDLRHGALDSIGEVLHENWMLKRSLVREISSEQIDHWYQAACAGGAIGGKIAGAGSGGVLAFYAREECHDAIIHNLRPLRRIQTGLDREGSRIVSHSCGFSPDVRNQVSSRITFPEMNSFQQSVDHPP